MTVATPSLTTRSPGHDVTALADLAARIGGVRVDWTPELRAVAAAAPVVPALLGPRDAPHRVRVLEQRDTLALVAVEGEETPRWIAASRLEEIPR